MFSPEITQPTEVQRQYLAAAEQRRQPAGRRAPRNPRWSARLRDWWSPRAVGVAAPAPTAAP